MELLGYWLNARQAQRPMLQLNSVSTKLNSMNEGKAPTTNDDKIKSAFHHSVTRLQILEIAEWATACCRSPARLATRPCPCSRCMHATSMLPSESWPHQPPSPVIALTVSTPTECGSDGMHAQLSNRSRMHTSSPHATTNACARIPLL
jgi:hypothetical protein